MSYQPESTRSQGPGGVSGGVVVPAAAALAEGAPAAGRRQYLGDVRRSLSCYALLIPSLALLGVFLLVPFIWAFTTSFYRFEVGGEAEWVGLGNYVEYLTRDPTALPSFGNMLFLTAFMVAVALSVPLVVAKLIFEVAQLGGERTAYFYRIMFLVPIVMPAVAMQMIWAGLVYGNDGLLNSTLSALGLPDQGWLSDPDLVLLCIAFVGFPFASGINVLIYYAGLTGIPQSVHEAARLDGVAGARKFFSIDVPMVLSQIKLLAVLSVITGIQGFEAILVMSQGGPGFESTVPGYWMYLNAFSFQRMGYACAIGVLLFLLILALTILNMRYIRSTEPT